MANNLPGNVIYLYMCPLHRHARAKNSEIQYVSCWFIKRFTSQVDYFLIHRVNWYIEWRKYNCREKYSKTVLIGDEFHFSFQAEELNAIVGNAFKMAYAQEREKQPTFNELIEQQLIQQKAQFQVFIN